MFREISSGILCDSQRRCNVRYRSSQKCSGLPRLEKRVKRETRMEMFVHTLDSDLFLRIRRDKVPQWMFLVSYSNVRRCWRWVAAMNILWHVNTIRSSRSTVGYAYCTVPPVDRYWTTLKWYYLMPLALACLPRIVPPRLHRSNRYKVNGLRHERIYTAQHWNDQRRERCVWVFKMLFTLARLDSWDRYILEGEDIIDWL